MLQIATSHLSEDHAGTLTTASAKRSHCLVSDLIIAVAVGGEVLPAADEHLVGPADGDLQRRVTHPGGGFGPRRRAAALGRSPPRLLMKPVSRTRLLLLPPPQPSLGVVLPDPLLLLPPLGVLPLVPQQPRVMKSSFQKPPAMTKLISF